jgi:hypothetical protein
VIDDLNAQNSFSANVSGSLDIKCTIDIIFLGWIHSRYLWKLALTRKLHTYLHDRHHNH